MPDHDDQGRPRWGQAETEELAMRAGMLALGCFLGVEAQAQSANDWAADFDPRRFERWFLARLQAVREPPRAWAAKTLPAPVPAVRPDIDAARLAPLGALAVDDFASGEARAEDAQRAVLEMEDGGDAWNLALAVRSMMAALLRRFGGETGRAIRDLFAESRPEPEPDLFGVESPERAAVLAAVGGLCPIKTRQAVADLDANQLGPILSHARTLEEAAFECAAAEGVRLRDLKEKKKNV